MNRRPPLRRLQKPDDAVRAVLHGWAPEAPQITPETQITAFGSCFAENISNWLAARNFRVLNREPDNEKAYVVSMGEGMVNSFVIRQQFEWAWENKVFEQPLWHGYKAEDFGYDEEVRLETKRIFDETDVFILTFGLSEVWYDEPTGNVFWRTIPKDVHDPERHKFRVSTVEENRANMRAIYDLIRKYRPDAKMIFTLSPIPLLSTFRDVSCLTANSTSKAVLRVALDELMRETEGEGHLFYWPSYEIIMDIFRQPFKADNRHPAKACLSYIMTLFEHVWCIGDVSDKPPLIEAWVSACAAAGHLPAKLEGIVGHRKIGPLERMIERATLDPDPAVDKAKRRLLEELRDFWLELGLRPRAAAD
ncbi:GSCFA domain-containing protein [Histidinibacterium aquaticum]|uniref:GSCFA domain-containing protein n=2 Tax=Histidinibacterium aquaticum TaxID=2613962 RepID=A0A5J5GJW5_9RHOB|nr:GSCFA domain-containing protein [Histidinibacterium aquaticum]